MMPLFATRFWACLIAICQNRWLFGLLRQNCTREACFWKEHFEFQNSTFLTWTRPDLGKMWKWVLPSNFASQMTRKTYVAPHSSYILIRRPHLTWNWPWPVKWSLRHPFSSNLAAFGLAAVSGLISATDKAKSQHWLLTWLWPNIWPFHEHYNNSLESHCREISITDSRLSLHQLIRSLDRGRYMPSPSLQSTTESG